MAQSGFYGQTVRQFLHLEQEPPSLITRSLRNAEIAVTETRVDAPVHRPSGEMGLADAYVVTLALNDFPDCEIWQRGMSVRTDVRSGAAYFYDMKKDPRFVISKPFHSLHFYLSRSALDGISEQSAAPRVGELPSQLGQGHDDAVIRHIGGSLLQALSRPAEINQLFIDHMMLAFTTHAAQTYGGMQRRAQPARGGLAPWQTKRACERLDSDLGGKLLLQQVAAEFDLSVSHFSRAFRISTGLAPHQWLLRQRVKAAKQLMTIRDLALSEIAISAGFADQSHFTRVFSAVVGVSPGAWRREAHGASEDAT